MLLWVDLTTFIPGYKSVPRKAADHKWFWRNCCFTLGNWVYSNDFLHACYSKFPPHVSASNWCVKGLTSSHAASKPTRFSLPFLPFCVVRTTSSLMQTCSATMLYTQREACKTGLKHCFCWDGATDSMWVKAEDVKPGTCLLRGHWPWPPWQSHACPVFSSGSGAGRRPCCS